METSSRFPGVLSFYPVKQAEAVSGEGWGRSGVRYGGRTVRSEVVECEGI